MAEPFRTVTITDFGAVGDGQVLNTAAINRAIDSVAAGGGVVRIPPGRFLTGTVRLRSGVTLRLEAGSRLVGTADLSQYQMFAHPGQTPKAWHRAMILGIDVQDAAICGEGVIDGAKVFDPQGEERMRGPHTILLGHCSRFDLRDVTIVDSANYAVLLERVDDFECRNVRFRGGWDGVHARGSAQQPCRRMSIVHCDFQTGDDAIAGWHWHDTVIAQCVINSSCNGIRVIGPVERLTVHGCLFFGPGRYEHRTQSRTNALAGILLQPGAWSPTQGRLDQILISDVTMRDLSCPLAVYTKPGNRGGRIVVERLTATGMYESPLSFESWDESALEHVVLRDITVDWTAAAVKDHAVPHAPPHVGVRPLPAWGLFVHRVARLDAHRVHLHIDGQDVRPAVVTDQIGHATMHEVTPNDD